MWRLEFLVGGRKLGGALGHQKLQLILGALALGYVHEYVHRPEQFARVVVEGVGVGENRKAPAVRALDEDPRRSSYPRSVSRARAIEHRSWAIGDPSGAYNLNEPQKRSSGSFSFGMRPHNRAAC